MFIYGQARPPSVRSQYPPAVLVKKYSPPTVGIENDVSDLILSLTEAMVSFAFTSILMVSSLPKVSTKICMSPVRLSEPGEHGLGLEEDVILNKMGHRCMSSGVKWQVDGAAGLEFGGPGDVGEVRNEEDGDEGEVGGRRGRRLGLGAGRMRSPVAATVHNLILSIDHCYR